MLTGSRIRIPLNVTVATDFASLDAVVLYDAAELERPKARRTGTGRRATIAADASTPGRLTIALAAARPMTSGTVAFIELRRTGTAPAPPVTLESATRYFSVLAEKPRSLKVSRVRLPASTVSITTSRPQRR
jgi:hypothetical protein